ncbi:hypothetical protein HU200_067634 [Digitaria exilis]|uniref:non-specific serine/threonine protein kinase n=1 Tax=Digitaria exilis TaxID=1010633 RepID=A0A835DS81_9POAL|nr:hypothetical protein HU200_067634 [Digitaria exilis]
MAPEPEAAGGGQAEPPDVEEDDPDVDEVDPTGRYLRYKEILGSGAFKTVYISSYFLSSALHHYKGFDAVDGIEVAWAKVEITSRIMGSPKELQRLKTEILLLRSLQHKHILKLYTSWVDNKKRTVNIITELFTSGNLRQFGTKLVLYKSSYLLIPFTKVATSIYVVVRYRTSEFMAPELFGENYNELVDIYSFGMCMLEMVTGECPYSECQGFVQIYKKISEGIKPVALSKIKDAEVRSFIESCLASAAERLPASELLKNPFLLKDDIINDKTSNPAQEPIAFPQNLDLDLDGTPTLVSFFSNGIVHDGKESFKLVLGRGGFVMEGVTSVKDPIKLLLRIPIPNGKCKNIEFAFDVEKDTSLSVATEMVEELELPAWSMLVVTKLIDAFLLKTVRGWRPCVQIGQMIQAIHDTASADGM